MAMWYYRSLIVQHSANSLGIQESRYALKIIKNRSYTEGASILLRMEIFVGTYMRRWFSP